MRIYFILISFLILTVIPGNSFCQSSAKIDSLLKSLLYSSGEKKVDALSAISDFYLRDSPEKSIQYANKALELSLTIGYKKGIGDSYNLLGIANYYTGQYADALNYYKMSLAVREGLKSKKEIASSFNNIGLVYNELGSYEKSLEFGLKSLKIREELGDKYNIGVSLLNTGLIYFNISDFKSALKNYQDALNIMEALQKENAVLIILNLLGNIHRKLNNPILALDYYNRSIRLSQKLSDKKGLADSYHNTANIYCDLKNYSTALEFYKKTLTLYNELGDKNEIANAYNNIALAYKELNNFKEMKSYLDKGLILAKSINAVPLLEDNYQFTSEYYEGIHDYTNSLKYFQMYSTIKDTLFNKQSNDQIEDLRTRYETEKKEQEIARLQQEKQFQAKELEVQSVWRASLTGGVILLGLLIFILYNRYNIKKKSELKIKQQNLVLENLNNEKNMFLGIAAHDLKNPLTSIIIDTATIKMLQEKKKTKEISLKLFDIESTAERMKDIVSKLLDLNKIESGNIKMEISEFNLTALIKELITGYNKISEAKNINLYYLPDRENIVIKSDKNLIIQIMDNLISNAIKFSNNDRNVHIKINSENSRIIINIKDEGPGFSENELNNLFNKFSKFSAKPTAGEHSTGLGLSIVKTLTEMLHGNVRCESTKGNGSIFYLELPVT
jgi:signal transduction histidine kinase